MFRTKNMTINRFNDLVLSARQKKIPGPKIRIDPGISRDYPAGS